MILPKLTYNAAAYFAEQEKYPDGLLDAISGNDTESFDAICWALSELSTQTELVRRDMGYDKRPILPAEYFRLRLKLPDLPDAKKVILDAVKRGMNINDEDEEVDEVLLELEKKTENAE